MTEHNEDESGPEHSFAALSEHTSKYKAYLARLKKGKPSGISSTFGKAAELLPPEALPNADDPDSIYKSNVNQESLRQAVASLLAVCNGDKDDPYTIGAKPEGFEQEIVGIYFEGHQKMLILDDGSIAAAPERPQQPPEPAPTALSLGINFAPAAGPSDETDAADAVADDEATSPPDAPDAISLSVDAALRELIPATADHSMDSEPDSKVPEPDSGTMHDTADTAEERVRNWKVTAPSGEILWHIVFEDDTVARILFPDGSTIEKTVEAGEFVLMHPMQEGQRMPRLEVLGPVTVDPKTGNLVYANLNLTHAVVLLNNGWRIDQHQTPYGTTSEKASFEIYVTEPKQPGSTERRKIRAVSAAVDHQSGTASYETIDGALVTLKCREIERD